MGTGAVLVLAIIMVDTLQSKFLKANRLSAELDNPEVKAAFIDDTSENVANGIVHPNFRPNKDCHVFGRIHHLAVLKLTSGVSTRDPSNLTPGYSTLYWSQGTDTNSFKITLLQQGTCNE